MLMTASLGHVSMHMIKESMELQLEYCDEAPFYMLGLPDKDDVKVGIMMPTLTSSLSGRPSM